jgi:hypothetical protein
MGLLDWLFGRRGRGPDAPAPTRDDTLSSTSVQSDQGWVAPPDPDIKVDEPAEADADIDADVSGGDTADTGGGDGGGDGGGGNGGGGGD